MSNKPHTAEFYPNIKLNPNNLTFDENTITTANPYRARVDLQFFEGRLDHCATTIDVDFPEGRKVVHMDKYSHSTVDNGDTGYITYVCDEKTGTGCLVRWPWSRRSQSVTTDPTVSKEPQDNRSASGTETDEAVTEEGDDETMSGH